MSDTSNTNGAEISNGSPQFTEREMQMLAWAMQSLKSGAPDIDYEKLAAFAGMGNPRSASNAWGKIKVKLACTTDGAPITPKKGGAKMKAAAKDDDANVEGADGESPTKKTPRKRVAKKQDVDGESASPKKKGRPAKNKKASDGENGDVKTEVKAETDGEDLYSKGEGTPSDGAAKGDEV